MNRLLSCLSLPLLLVPSSIAQGPNDLAAGVRTALGGARSLVQGSATATVPAKSSSQGYSFKGNYLGMSLSEFKKANATDEVYVNAGSPNFFGRAEKKYTQAVPTPLCTDEMRGFPGDPTDLADGEVACNVSPVKLTRMPWLSPGIQVFSVLYRLNHERLYRIDITFPAAAFVAIRWAFQAKYGRPVKTSDDSFQNGYGATWKGANVYWNSDAEDILLTEGSENGPAQDSLSTLHPSMALFMDHGNRPATEKQALDF